MRAFIGIPIPEELREEIRKIGNEIEMRGIKLVEPENLHWTVKFFGDLDDSQTKKIMEIMNSIKGEEIEIEISGVGTFPDSSYIRVVWIGVGQGKEKFTKFMNEVNKKFSGIGKNAEVTPHLTIGRVKFIENKEELGEKIQKIKNECIGKMRINQLILYESQLTPKGPVYKEIKKITW